MVDAQHISSQTENSFSVRSILAPLAAIVLGTFMAVLDTTAVNVALPTLERAFRSDLHLMQWTITGYALAQAAVIPLSGWLSDRFGAKRLYLIALVLFTLGSVLCAAAPSAGALVAFRVLQGLGGGMLLPIGMSFVYRLAPPARVGAVMGIFGIPILLGPALGPILSGWLVQYADWRYVFLINLPVGIAAVALGVRALPDLKALGTTGALDTLGVFLGPLAFASLSYGISQSTTDTWTGATTLAGLTIGALALAAFIARELTVETPLLELRVFRRLDFSLAIVTQWIVAAALFGSLFLLPLFLQQVRGYGALDAGLALLPQAIGAGLFMMVGGRVFDRFGARPTVLAGALLITAGLWFLSGITSATTGINLIVPLFIWGSGLGLAMLPLNTQILNSAPRNLVSRVTSLTSALQSVVVSLAVATYATILQGRITTHIAAAKTGLERYASDPIHGAMAAAFDDTFRVAMGVAAVAIVLALTLRRRANRAGEEAEVPVLMTEEAISVA